MQPSDKEGLTQLSLIRHNPHIRVMIAEDMMINAELLGNILDMKGVAHEWAENGKIALERFEQNPDGYYDAILMDTLLHCLSDSEVSVESGHYHHAEYAEYYYLNGLITPVPYPSQMGS